jgi:hypothetical protein
MLNNFELLKCNIDLEIEKEKMDICNLSLKLLFNLKKEKNLNLDEPEEFNMSEEELKLMETLLKKHHNIVVFLQQMNKFRSRGCLVMRPKAYVIFGKLFNLIMNIIIKDNDIYSTKSIIILSQTYFYKDSQKKEYLQMKIIHNKIFKNLKFWDDIFNLEMNLEIQKIVTTEILDFDNIYSKMSSEEMRQRNKNKYGQLAFGAIMTIANNMIDFGIKPKEAYEMLAPKIKLYQLDNQSIETIKTVLKINKEEKEEKNNIIEVKENVEEIEIKVNENKDEKKDNDNINEINENKNKINENKDEKKDNDNINEINENQNKINENKNENDKEKKEEQENEDNKIEIIEIKEENKKNENKNEINESKNENEKNEKEKNENTIEINENKNVNEEEKNENQNEINDKHNENEKNEKENQENNENILIIKQEE